MGQKAEGSAGIQNIGQMKYIPYERNRFTQLHVADYNPFHQLVENSYENSNQYGRHKILLACIISYGNQRLYEVYR